VTFNRQFSIESAPATVVLYVSADTRYKLHVNGTRVAVGPSRSSPLIWYYDTLEIAPYLRKGINEVKFTVLRYFAANRAAMPFERTSFPGLTVVGSFEADAVVVDLCSRTGWVAEVDEGILFPTGLINDGFLHVRMNPLI
jgi:hypothetical protein